MPQLPNSLEEAIAQAKEATQLALETGLTRLQVELVFPEIALKAQEIALQFTSLFESQGIGLKVLFCDTGAAALARRDWGEIAFRVTDLGSRLTPVETKVAPEDEIFLIVCPSSVEVNKVEQLCQLAGDRPVILLIPQLEDVSIVGIGYTARQLRERFINTLESCYYIRPLEGGTVFRVFPEKWQVWLEKDENYELIAETAQKPIGEALERIINQALNPNQEDSNSPQPQPKKNIFSQMQSFLKALNS
jgi:hypothetical protein